MATTKKIYAGDKKRWMAMTKMLEGDKKMGGNDKDVGKQHGILWGKNAIDGSDKEDGWRRQRRWMETKNEW